jgi:hypothetical protein
MKRIIDGKVYNTETAECVATWSNGYYTNDFHYCEESIYKTKKGAWFVEGEGGALSQYARSCGNETCGGHVLWPITEQEAQEWLEQHDFTDKLKEHFGDKIEEA